MTSYELYFNSNVFQFAPHTEFISKILCKYYIKRQHIKITRETQSPDEKTLKEDASLPF